jgi:predicted kinase
MPVTLYLLCGKSFSGKSTLAEVIARQTGAIVVGLDSINAERGLFGGLGIPDHEWAVSHDVALQRVEDAIASGRSVVVDDTNCFRFLRDSYRSVAQRLGIPSVLLYLDVPVSILRQRITACASSPGRSPVTEEVFTDLLSKFEAPAPDEQAVLVPPDSPAAAWVAHNIVPHHGQRVG